MKSMKIIVAIVSFIIASGACRADVFMETLDNQLKDLRYNYEAKIAACGAILNDPGDYPRVVPAKIRAMRKELDEIESFAMMSNKHFDAVTSRLFTHMDVFISKFRRGTKFPKDMVDPHKKWYLDEDPRTGLMVDAVLLMELANKTQSLKLTRKVLMELFEAGDAESYWGEELFLSDGDPYLSDAISEARRRDEGVPSEEGEDLAWLCEQYLVSLYPPDNANIPEEAKTAVNKYWQWRNRKMQEYFQLTKKDWAKLYLPKDCQQRTLAYARGFALAVKRAE